MEMRFIERRDGESCGRGCIVARRGNIARAAHDFALPKAPEGRHMLNFVPPLRGLGFCLHTFPSFHGGLRCDVPPGL